MNDPWDVKSVRQPGHYVSCMKINGVPLLPPVLSKECREEMQYYKLLAKEVEKRISQLKAYIGDSDVDSAQDKTDAPDLPQEYEQAAEPLKKVLKDEVITNALAYKEEKLSESSDRTSSHSPDLYDSNTSSDTSHGWPKFSFDLSLKKDETYKPVPKNTDINPQDAPQPIDPPERDYNTTPKKNAPNNVDKASRIDVTNLETNHGITNKPLSEKKDLFRIEFDICQVEPLLSNPFPDMATRDGPSSLGSKSFTGSLNNIYSESAKETSNLVRQSSYTVLNPSPLLLAHLKVQSLSTGVEVSSISMSESLSNLTPKKRRSWDLEAAKMKWSTMAHELKQKTAANTKPNDVCRSASKPTIKKGPQRSPLRSKSVSVHEKPRRASLPGKAPKSEPLQKPKQVQQSPYLNNSSTTANAAAKQNVQKTTQPSPNRKLISECEDPATKVKELYEKIQNQQLLQMASLVEKQKREQMLLQQVFEEQNSILYRQLKTICPKSPIEAKAAWGDKLPQNDRGPVSLSQLINHKSPEQDGLTSTLSDTHNNLSKCDAVLKKSKDITGSIKRDKIAARSVLSPEASRTRSQSPVRQRASRKLSYDTSASSEREFEPILTDRTNDTMAGLNVTFTSDSDDVFARQPRAGDTREETQHTLRAVPAKRPVPCKLPPTPAQLAAASTIVAHAKGYLVRRLLRTERVQATVQTIKDALLCALQLHQDRAGIRGADVDLHRRLIQQITAACYSLHDTFVASTPRERCALIAADRERRKLKPAPVARHHRQKSDIMSQSHTGAFPARAPRSAPAHSLMTQSNYETFSGSKSSPRSYVGAPRRRPWR